MKTMDHKNYPFKLRSIPNNYLRFIIDDCRLAIKAMPDNPNCGYYSDEISYAAMELKRRKDLGICY